MSQPVRIPADVDREDRVIGPLTARQLLILSVTGIVLYGAYTLTRTLVPVAVFLVVAVPVAVISAVLALGQRDGISLDRLAVAALRQRLSAQHQVSAPEGVRTAPEWLGGGPSTVPPAELRLPAEAVTDTGVIDLGKDGLAVVAVCSTVNFSLRTPAEQESLVASFGRYLHSLTAPVQVLVRAERLDLSGQIAELHERAGGLPHPALEQAAREHAEYLDQLGRATELLRRQVLLVLREPLSAVDEGSKRAADARLVRRLGEAFELLSPSGIVVSPLDAGQATAVLAAACNPDRLLPPNSGLAGSDEVITSVPDEDWADNVEQEYR